MPKYSSPKQWIFRLLIAAIISLGSMIAHGQQLYYPPTDSDVWESVDPTDAGWDNDKLDSLSNYLEQNESKAFILLQGGKIVKERYYKDHNAETPHYWASAGKTLTAFVTGMAIDEGLLELTTPVSDLLGEGWSNCSAAQEYKRQIIHHLTMTSTLDETVDWSCTQPECFECIGEPGTRWAYHNGAYTLMLEMLEAAYDKQSINDIVEEYITPDTGIEGNFLKIGDNRIFVSTPRSFARFGLLLLGKGDWNGKQILKEKNYLEDMTRTSQEYNESYGYLTWVNSGESYMQPLDRTVYEGKMVEALPASSFAGLGANGQIVAVIPEWDVVYVRMGSDNSQSLTSNAFFSEISLRLKQARIASTVSEGKGSSNEHICDNSGYRIVNGFVVSETTPLSVYDLYGREIGKGKKIALPAGRCIIISKGKPFLHEFLD
jgi:CubicO group peptidase (beta-lactamase class C family)